MISAWRISLLAFFLLVFAGPDACAQRLQGGVEHREELPPVNSQLKVGTEFNRSFLPRLVPQLRWYKVPAWSVGTWRVETLTNYYRRDFKTGVVDTTQTVVPFKSDKQTFGMQKDSQGGIWHYDAAPYVVDVDIAYGTQVQQIEEEEMVKLSNSEITDRLRSTTLVVSKTNLILDLYQAESIQSYSPYGKDLIRCLASVKRFDDKGQAKELVQNVCAMRRIQGFTPINMFNGIDLKASFKAYLLSHKLNHLVPGYLSPAKD
ncbi:MAG: hypothetical protein K2X29_10920 [Candidatus Obscuribacterales bacterium]|nr:hypothetical protein [Candidatus Obscuribacterales bacterium]